MVDGDPKKILRRLWVRLALSLTAFTVFVGMLINAFLRGDGKFGVGPIIPIAIALFALPYHRRSGTLDVGLRADEPDADAVERVRRMGKLATTLRLVYFLVILVGFGLVRYLGH